MKTKFLNESVPGDQFQWPEYADEKARIRAYTERFRNKSVVEAFQEVYNVNLNGVSEKANEMPREYRVGDIIHTRIHSVTKDRVEFSDINYKGTVQSSVNLWKYPNFRYGNYNPNDEIDVVVVDSKKGRISVDPIRPMTDKWISDTILHPAEQRTIGSPKTIKIKNLQLTGGGFTGKAVIPTTSAFVGEDIMVDAFIPGSQIVLNITDNFEQFVGKDVNAFVVNYIDKGGEMSLICSVKSVLLFEGHLNMIEMFNRWCEDNPKWKEYNSIVHDGKVTGVINSSKKCGVFVEVPDLKITGMVETTADELVAYAPGTQVKVRVHSFDEETFFNKITQQMQHVEPYVIEDGVLVKCNLKPILVFA